MKTAFQLLTYSTALLLFSSSIIYSIIAHNRISLLKVLFMQFYFSCENKKYRGKSKKENFMEVLCSSQTLFKIIL